MRLLPLHVACTLSPSRSRALLGDRRRSSPLSSSPPPPPSFLIPRFGTARSRSPSSNFTSYVPSPLSRKILPGYMRLLPLHVACTLSPSRSRALLGDRRRSSPLSSSSPPPPPSF